MPRPIGEIMGEIAYLDFCLRQMYEDSKKVKSPIELMIDKACDVDALRLKEAKKLIRRINFLQKQLDKM